MMGCMEYVIRNMEYGKNQVSPVILNSFQNLIMENGIWNISWPQRIPYFIFHFSYFKISKGDSI